MNNTTELHEVLRQLDDRTNQTWAVKRKRWAALVRAQTATIAEQAGQIETMKQQVQRYADANKELRDAAERDYYQIEALRADAKRWRSTLVEVRHALEVANTVERGPIRDTIWMDSRPETLFDFIDAALQASGKAVTP